MNKNKNFRIEVELPNYNLKVDHNRSVITLGSCFASELNSLMAYYGFDTVRPYGTIYNPMSLANNLKNCLDDELFTEENLLINKSLYFSWCHSGSYYSKHPKLLLKEINDEQARLRKMFSCKPLILVTFGSSIIYTHQKNDKVVANCHKQKSGSFIKSTLSMERIVSAWNEIINELDADFVFTVSPVRHYREGLVENNRSKARLLLAIEEIIKANPKKSNYFPSYEIIMDELRDYRFYKDDWIHPSKEAVEYVWSKFQDSFLTMKAIALNDDISKIRKSLDHRSKFGLTEDHVVFLEGLKMKINKIMDQTPYYSWETELKKIDSQLFK